MNPRPASIHVQDSRLAAIAEGVRAYPWDRMPNAGGWSAGTSKAFLHSLCEYWLARYDWRRAEQALNRYPQFRMTVNGMSIHFWHVRAAGGQAGRRPLLLLHGWPGSAFEFHHLIDALADPGAHGGDPADGFDLVIPCLPGYGFSGIPAAPAGARDVAEALIGLMAALGHDRYLTQGGDWGGILSSWIGILDPGHCAGAHLNMAMPGVPDPASAEETEWAAQFAAEQSAEGAYGHLQMTRPQSLGFAMAESPVGVAAWVIEKFAAWSDLPRTAEGEPDLLARYSHDELLTNIMFYLAEDRFVSSTWLYHGSARPGQLPFAGGERCTVPTAIAAFPDPVFIPPPPSLAARHYNLVRHTVMPRGGHFAAMEAPDLLLGDLRIFARQVFG